MSSPVSSSPSPTYYEIALAKIENIKDGISAQAKKLPKASRQVLEIALPAIAVASAVYATAPVTIAFVAAVIIGNKLAPSLVSEIAAGRVLMAVGATLFAVKIAIPFSTLVIYAAGSAALGFAGYKYSTGSMPGSQYINSFFNPEQPRTRRQ